MATEHERLIAFLTESNRIENIFHVKPGEIDAAGQFLALPAISIGDIESYLKATAPHAVLREWVNMDVRVGSYSAPPGGHNIRSRLNRLLVMINDEEIDDYDAHIEYEVLHPFTDGNGRSGRLLWLWQHRRNGDSDQLSFLHRWYYQSLDR